MTFTPRMLLLLGGLTTHVLNAQTVVINEFMAVNDAAVQDDNQNYSDWIELYNGSPNTLDLSNYYLTDNRNKLSKWQFPTGTLISSGAYTVCWATGLNQGLHTNFKLAGSNDAIYLTNGTTILDSVNYALQLVDVSFGRDPADASTWQFFTNYTPGSANGNDGVERLERVEFSVTGGQYNNGFNLTLSHPDPSATIYYTTDGSEPNQNADQYGQAISIDGSTPVRAVAIRNGFLNSIITTHTYLLGEQVGLPIVNISTDPDNFFDDEIGIYVAGTNGIAGNCTGPRNWNQDWERPVNFEYYVDGQQEINMMMGTAIMGGCSRTQAMKSQAMKARKQYEGKTVHYPFFSEKPEIDEFQSFLLRNSGNDFGNLMFRDAYLQRVMKDQMDLEYQAYQPVHMYLNGDYWGIHNIRERASEKYLTENTSAVADSVDLLELNDEQIGGWSDIKEGSDAHWEAMREYLRTSGVASASNYEYMKTLVDVENFAEYYLMNIYVGNTDWPGNNMRYWRDQRDGGKWRWFVYDLDFGFGLYEPVNHNTLAFCLDDSQDEWPNPAWATEHFRQMWENADFRELFLDRMLGHMAITYDPDRTDQILDEMGAYVEPELDKHFDRWTGSMNNYNSVKNDLKDFAAARPAYMMSFLSDEFNLNSDFDLTVTTTPGGAELSVNQVNSPIEGFDGKFFTGQSVKLFAAPEPLHKFVGWHIQGAGSEDVIFGKESNWSYLDDGTDQSASYFTLNYDDSGWSSGQGRLGYGGDGENTEVSYGASASFKYPTTYFRKEFQVADPSALQNLLLNITVDDGMIVYINETEVARYNMPSGAVAFDEYASDFMSAPDETTYFPFDVDPSVLVAGTNLVAVEVHNSSRNSSDMGFDMEMIGESGGGLVLLSSSQQYEMTSQDDIDIIAVFEAIPLAEELSINELVADNETGVQQPAGVYPDWIELYNAGNEAVDVGGLYISDDPNHLGLWQIPNTQPDSTTVGAGGHIVLYADKQDQLGVLHLGFKLSAGGEVVYLSQFFEGDTVVLSSVSFGEQTEDVAYGAYPDGSGNYSLLTEVTPGAQNEIPNPLSGIYINEFMTGNNGAVADAFGEFDDWVEFYNDNDFEVDLGGLFLSDTLGELHKWRIPTNRPDSTTIPGKGHLIIWMDNTTYQGATHADFKLGDADEDIVLTQQLNGPLILDQVSYGKQWTDVSQGRYPDGGSQWVRYNNYTPGQENVRDPFPEGLFINEIVAGDNDFYVDNRGEYDDFIELYNGSDQTIDIGGLWFTDSLALSGLDRVRSHKPDSTSIAPGEFLILWADGQPEQGVLHLDFKLSEDGESVGVCQAFGPDTLVVDTMTFGPLSSGISHGRYPDGAAAVGGLTIITPNASNAMADSITGIYINEFMTGNDQAHADHAGENDDWIELYNDNPFSVDVGGLYITDNSADPMQYRIPVGVSDSTTIPAFGFLVLWADNQSLQGALHTNFSLEDSGEDIVLSQLRLQPQVVDQYSYNGQWRDVSEGRYVDAGNNWERFNNYTPGAPNERDESLAGKVAVNEILVVSTAGEMDEYGEYDDYVEFFNLTNAPVDIGGAYIGPGEQDTAWYRIPSNAPDMTTIPAGGFVTIWLDNQPLQGPLHAGIKFGENGGDVGLFQIAPDTVSIDVIAYPTGQDDVSFGRYGDGEDLMVSMSTLTPGQSNELDPVGGISQENDELNWQVYPNPARESIVIQAGTELVGQTAILRDVLGNEVLRLRLNGRNSVDLSTVPAGIYTLTTALHPGQSLRLTVQN